MAIAESLYFILTPIILKLLLNKGGNQAEWTWEQAEGLPILLINLIKAG
jgi:hypothetical protein